MTTDESQRVSRFDPRYSSSFQRGGDGPTGQMARPVPPPLSRPSRSSPPASVSPDPSERPADDGYTAEGQAAVSRVHRPAPHPSAVRFVRVWGGILVVAAIASWAAGFALQQQAFGSIGGAQQAVYFGANIVMTFAPLSLALGIGMLVFAGYAARAGRDDDIASLDSARTDRDQP